MVPRVVIMDDFDYNLTDPLSVAHQLVETLSEPNFQVLRFGNTFFHNSGSCKQDLCAVLDANLGSIRSGEFSRLGEHVYLFFNVNQPGSAVLSERPPVKRRLLTSSALGFQVWIGLQFVMGVYVLS